MSLRLHRMAAFVKYFSLKKRSQHCWTILELAVMFMQLPLVNKIKHIPESANITKNYHSEFFTAAELVRCCDLVVSPDTSIVHLSRAFNKRIVCVYPFKILNHGADNAVDWGPNYSRACQIKLVKKNIMDTDISVILSTIEEKIQSLRESNK